MGTTFDHIIDDHCMVLIDDYKLTQLYSKTHADPPATPEWPVTKWQKVVDGYLHIAINRFSTDCDHLDYDELNRTFNNELSMLEIDILTFYWVIAWARREINNSSQLQLKLKIASGFTFSSEGSTLKAKMIWLDSLEEEVARKITQYQLANSKLGSYNW